MLQKQVPAMPQFIENLVQNCRFLGHGKILKKNSGFVWKQKISSFEFLFKAGKHK